jgi:hypothetical protein
MRELAETLKRSPGLRMRQGVVTATDGSTCSVLIGGSDVPVDGVQHLNSCAPAAGEVVWIASDGADLWIIGTHGDPPPIDPSRLPAFETYFTDADPAGDPAAVTGLSGSAGLTGTHLVWNLPPEALWRTWKVFEGAASGFTPGDPVLVADAPVVTVPNEPGSGPWYYRVRAVNSRGEESSDIQVGPFTLPTVLAEIPNGSISAVKISDLAIETPKLAANAVTAAKINVADVQAAIVTAAKVNTLALNAGAISTGYLSADRIAAGSITAAKLNVADVQAAVVTAAKINTLTLNALTVTGGTITGTTITGTTIRTAASGTRVEITGGANDRITWYDAYTSAWQSVYGDASSSALNIVGPERRSSGITTGCQIQLVGYSTYPCVKIQANDCMLTVGTQSGNNRFDGALYVFGGGIRPGTNWQSGVSEDGIWIQDANYASRRYKLYFDSGNGRLYVRFDGSTYSYFARSGGSSAI